MLTADYSWRMYGEEHGVSFLTTGDGDSGGGSGCWSARAGSAQPAAKQPGAANDNADADNALEGAEDEDADTGLQNGASLMNGAALHEPRGYLRKNGRPTMTAALSCTESSV